MAQVTLFKKTLQEAVLWREGSAKDFEAAYPDYLNRLRAACSRSGDTLTVNEYDQATACLRDDEDGDTAEWLDQTVAFWG